MFNIHSRFRQMFNIGQSFRQTFDKLLSIQTLVRCFIMIDKMFVRLSFSFINFFQMFIQNYQTYYVQ